MRGGPGTLMPGQSAEAPPPSHTPCLLHPFHLAVPELCQLKKRKSTKKKEKTKQQKKKKYSLKAEKYVLHGRLSENLSQGGSLSDSCEGLLRRGKVRGARI